MATVEDAMSDADVRNRQEDTADTVMSQGHEEESLNISGATFTDIFVGDNMCTRSAVRPR